MPYETVYKKIIAFYDNNVDAYINNTKVLYDWEWMEKFCTLLPKKARVLDMGRAFGRDSVCLVKQGFDTYGINLSKKMIHKAQELVPSATFKVMDIASLEFKNSYFDGIWCSATLLHIKKGDIPTVLQEINRVLKKTAWSISI